MAKKAIKVYLKDAVEGGFSFIKRRFKALKEMNENFHAQRKWIFEKLERKSDYKRRLSRVLEVIKLHSCKFIGISYMTENSMCEAYEKQFREQISKRTVHALVNHLRELKFVTAIPTKRGDGKQSANILVLEKLAIIQGDTTAQELAHKDEQNLHTKRTSSSLKTTDKDPKERNTKDRPGQQKQGNDFKSQKRKQERLLNFVPKWFRERIACCSTEAKSVYEYWKVAKHLMQQKFAERISQEDKPAVIQAAIREYYQAAKAASRGKFEMRKPFGFFHTVLATEASAHVRRQAQVSSTSVYNWLEDYVPGIW